jgi:hypothetical protein
MPGGEAFGREAGAVILALNDLWLHGHISNRRFILEILTKNEKYANYVQNAKAVCRPRRGCSKTFRIEELERTVQHKPGIRQGSSRL